MKSAVKRKRLYLFKKHCKERVDFAIAHKGWTVGLMILKSVNIG